MGGLGSGRWQDGWSRRPIVERSDGIRADRIAKPVDLDPSDGTRLRLHIEAKRDDGKRVQSGPYTMVAAACRFGGVRWFWLCPHCGRRRMWLYQAWSGYYSCRECLRLTYWSRQKSRAYDGIIRSMLASRIAEPFWTPYLMRRVMFDHVGRKRGRKWWNSTLRAAQASGMLDETIRRMFWAQGLDEPAAADSKTGMEQE